MRSVEKRIIPAIGPTKNRANAVISTPLSSARLVFDYIAIYPVRRVANTISRAKIFIPRNELKSPFDTRRTAPIKPIRIPMYWRIPGRFLKIFIPTTRVKKGGGYLEFLPMRRYVCLCKSE